MGKGSTERFSDRVHNYVKYRPSYPEAVLQTLQAQTGLTSSSVVADIGSGTGISARLFLQNGNPVYAVEPNPEMRQAAEHLLSADERFSSITGSAEQTTLPNRSVDYILAAQAFHWFDHAAAKGEFQRILRSGGWVILLWNTRQVDTTPFLSAYENIVQRYGIDYREIRHRNIEQDRLTDFLGETIQDFRFPNYQLFDYDSLKGRLQSSSYIPTETHANYPPMIEELMRVFNQYAVDGAVRFEYETELYLARWP